MRKSHKKRPEKIVIPAFLVNQKIQAKEVRLIDESGTMVGVVSLQEALRRALEIDLDLVEVSPKAVPPVCKIISYSSFRYQKEKEIKAQKQKQKIIEVKGVRLSLRIGTHDKEIRLVQAKKFLEEGNKVRVELMLKGRERQYTPQARTIIQEFVKELGEDIKTEQPLLNQEGKLNTIVYLQK